MNTALIINSHNLGDIEAFAAAAAESQKTKVNGALAVVFQSKLGTDVIQAVIGALSAKFATTKLIPVNLNGGLDNDARNSTLFAIFVAQAYAAYPGPWLIIDGPGLPKVENIFNAVLDQHKLLAGTVSGRVAQQGVSMTPVGPVVLGLPVKKLSWFSPSVTESWRARARFLFSRCGFKIVPIADYLFNLSESAIPAPLPEPPRKEPAAPPVFNPAVLDPAPKTEAPPVASTQRLGFPSEQPQDGDPIVINEVTFRFVSGPATSPDEIGIGESLEETTDNFDTVTEAFFGSHGTGAVPPAYDDMEKEELLALIESRQLPKPHHATGKARLIEILRESDGLAPEEAAPETTTPAE